MSFKTKVNSTVAAAYLPTIYGSDSYVFINDGAARILSVKGAPMGNVVIAYRIVATGEEKFRYVKDYLPVTFTAYVEDWPGEPAEVWV